MTGAFKTSTFLIGAFHKLKIKDKDTRKKLTIIYFSLIKTILHHTSSIRRIEIFKVFLPIMQNTANILKSTKSSNSTQLMQNLKIHANFCKHLVEALESNTDSAVFNDILNQVNIEDIACEIGDCLKAFKQSDSSSERKEIQSRLEFLLIDYNSVEGTSLQVTNLLPELAVNESEL